MDSSIIPVPPMKSLFNRDFRGGAGQGVDQLVEAHVVHGQLDSLVMVLAYVWKLVLHVVLIELGEIL